MPSTQIATKTAPFGALSVDDECLGSQKARLFALWLWLRPLLQLLLLLLFFFLMFLFYWLLRLFQTTTMMGLSLLSEWKKRNGNPSRAPKYIIIIHKE
uniref:Uncharacterized protein n=1 Tax=Caenorhabditis tropicalis TaxID=1561998 RepID=A0A1I7T666_9PELO